jgi:hypothetical protein
MFISPTLHAIGTKTFFGCFVLFILPPSGILLIFFLGESTLLVDMNVAWAWGDGDLLFDQSNHWDGCWRVLGLLVWYIGSGNGPGNPYGLAALLSAVLATVMGGHLFFNQGLLQATIMRAATCILIIGYSIVDT